MSKNNYLFQQIRIGNKISENRLAVNSLECCDADSVGNPSEKTYRRYNGYFEGGFGLVFLESITITYESRLVKMQLSIMPRNEKALKKFIDEIKAINPKTLLILQLTHSGEASNPEFSKRVTVKPLPGIGGKLLTEEALEKIIDDFVISAKIAHSAGADGVDIKLCHGNNIGSQILRPYNDRKWKYGGSWENRTRFAYNIYERIQKEINDPNFIVGSKISVWEGFPGGCGSSGPDSALVDLTESLDLVKNLEARGAKFILVSAGGALCSSALAMPDRKYPEDVYIHFTFQKAVKSVLKPETVVIGSGYSVLNKGNNNLIGLNREEASIRYWGNKNIKDGVTDMIAIGRQSLADSFIAAKLKENKDNKVRWCTACNRCFQLVINKENSGCCTYFKEYRDAYRMIKNKKTSEL
ncbi:MAG TPA: 2,4-dienoyl-CoA reductase [Clostridiales bacterium]|nr:2,4-dienoyl-CoA reductase [Clostridiales bacterium]